MKKNKNKKKNKGKFGAILLSLIMVFSLAACSSTSQSAEEEASQSNTLNKIKVSVTFDAMKEFAAAVGKDKIEIATIIPAGTEAHDFEPKAQDLVKLSEAKIFVYNGLGMDDWAEDAVTAASNADLIVVEASHGVNIIEREGDNHDEEDIVHEEEDDEDGHAHGKYDPHLWLSLKEAQAAVANIKDALVQADPDNKDFYEQNYSEFAAQAENLYNEYAEKFNAVENKTFVTGHAAFAYLCRDFGLEQNSIRDLFADGEPSAKQLTALVEYCRANNVTTIFTEEMVSPAVSQTLASEVGASVETIYTIENAQEGMTYLERMESNLSKIYASLAI